MHDLWPLLRDTKTHRATRTHIIDYGHIQRSYDEGASYV